MLTCGTREFSHWHCHASACPSVPSSQMRCAAAAARRRVLLHPRPCAALAWHDGATPSLRAPAQRHPSAEVLHASAALRRVAEGYERRRRAGRPSDGQGAPPPHLRRDWGPAPATTAPGLGLIPATSAPGLGSPLPHLHRPAASTPYGLRSPLPHLHRGWARRCATACDARAVVHHHPKATQSTPRPSRSFLGFGCAADGIGRR